MGRINFAFTPEEKTDARAALKLLAGVASLETAARAYLSGKRTIARKSVSEIADTFLRSRITNGARRATWHWYDERLRYVVTRFGDVLMDDVTRAEFREWLAGLPHRPSSKAGTARAARALWRWAIQHEPPLAVIDVTVGCNFKVSSRNGEGSAKVLTVAQCESILRGVPLEHRSPVALMLFAGVRPEEVAGEGGKPWLRWEHVNTVERIVRVPAECSKIGASRVMEDLPETLWHWLTPPGPLTDTVAKIQRRSVLEHIKRAGGFGGDAPWPQDALRHTFASYAVAAYNDAGKVAHWLGHNGNPTMLHRFYRGLVTKAEAEKFWALRPS
jgi:integrase